MSVTPIRHRYLSRRLSTTRVIRALAGEWYDRSSAGILKAANGRGSFNEPIPAGFESELATSVEGRDPSAPLPLRANPPVASSRRKRRSIG